jgi:hypothetical protein
MDCTCVMDATKCSIKKASNIPNGCRSKSRCGYRARCDGRQIRGPRHTRPSLPHRAEDDDGETVYALRFAEADRIVAP